MAEKTIRRSQLISPFGVGAIYDLGDESMVVSDISNWGKNNGARLPEIHLKRLEALLRVSGFRMPPVPRGRYDRNPERVLLHRFPQWLFCASCRRLYRWSRANEAALTDGRPVCLSRSCRSRRTLVPIRFVACCEDGHLMDVPWDRWAHSTRSAATHGQCQDPDLRFQSVKGAGSGLASVRVSCKRCKSGRSLAGITVPGAFKSMGARCEGRQPWQRWEERVECDRPPQALQRGESNLHYGTVFSALDMPVLENGNGRHDEELRALVHAHNVYSTLVEILGSSSLGRNDGAVSALAGIIARDLGCELDLVLDIASADNAGPDDGEGAGGLAGPDADESALLEEEWRILSQVPADGSDHPAFRAERRLLPAEPAWLTASIESVVLVHRLREVRCFSGFSRLRPRPPREVVRADLGRQLTWLPAVEVFGEGICLVFSEAALLDWERRASREIKARLDPMTARHAQAGLAFLPAPTPRRVLLHTLSHVLMRQLAFECGYSAASIRERIYAAEPDAGDGPMAGLLIYTADSDSEGSLGGLVRQGEPSRLMGTLEAAVSAAAWCSADPICRELPGQGLKGLNRAACHACALVAETSCAMSNTMLDRALLTPSPDGVGPGFFRPG